MASNESADRAAGEEQPDCIEEEVVEDLDFMYPTSVGLGASAGGLEAFSQLLKHLPTDTGMAFVMSVERHQEVPL